MVREMYKTGQTMCTEQKVLCCLTSTMASVSCVSFRTVRGTSIAAHSVSAAVSSTTTSVICCTFVDIYVNTSKAGLCILKDVYLAYHIQVFLSPVYPSLHSHFGVH